MLAHVSQSGALWLAPFTHLPDYLSAVTQENTGGQCWGRLLLSHLPALCVPGGSGEDGHGALDAAPTFPGMEADGLCLDLVSVERRFRVRAQVLRAQLDGCSHAHPVLSSSPTPWLPCFLSPVLVSLPWAAWWPREPGAVGALWGPCFHGVLPREGRRSMSPQRG